MDAADVWRSGTLNNHSLQGGVEVNRGAQRICNCKHRAKSIIYRELKAIRMMFTGLLARRSYTRVIKLFIFIRTTNRSSISLTPSSLQVPDYSGTINPENCLGSYGSLYQYIINIACSQHVFIFSLAILPLRILKYRQGNNCEE